MALTDKQETLVTIYQVEVWKGEDYINEIDGGGPSGTEDWYSLCLGWALGKGLNPKEAHEFASHIRYNTNMA